MNLIIAGGGTGGHLYPGIAVARDLLKQSPESKVLFIGSVKELDAKLIEDEGFVFAPVSQKPFPSKLFPFKGIQFIWSCFQSLFQALPLVRCFKPDAVLGMGGFSSVPTILAARLLGVSAILFEPNLYPGKANRFLAPFAKKIAVGFKFDKPFFSANKMVCVGIPVRESILALSQSRQPYSGEGAFNLLIMGGSRGARGINQAILSAYSLLKKEIPELKLVHVTGKDLFEAVQQEYKKNSVLDEIELYPFVSDIDRLMKKADLVIARSGASSLAEFAACGLPSILIPYPYSTQDHQIHNARFFEQHGAAKMILEKELTESILIQTIAALKSDLSQLNGMSRAARNLSVDQSSLSLLNLLIGLGEKCEAK